ncbi:Receptor expression-enhancing protein 4 [Pseudolycoriella hygida]|uniref:Receptor expression-enhancing protein 4 n=1 Tax=Pseudolycoriella hygida TaxID=35572 RepID=A0A9Q0ND63_9DIPT|nr:Receptor expression-enhancing protein 4 [Pseudolycoriella hygida]
MSKNSISAIISKFEEKRFPIRQPKTDIHSKLKMGDTKILQGNEVFKDVNRSNGNRNILLENSNLKTFKNSEIQSRGRSLLNLFSWFVFLLSSVNGAIATTLTLTFLLPRALIKSLFYPGYRLLFGTLYPAYASYKAVRTKNVKEYVKWMMYWIVFALFSCTETFTDIFLSWFPLYYEIKVIIVIWLLSPATKGSSILYRKFVHPMLTKREQEIDEYISQAKEKGYSAVLQYGSRGVNYATSVIMQTALKTIDNIVLNKPAQKPLINANDVPDGPDPCKLYASAQHGRLLKAKLMDFKLLGGGNLVSSLKKSYSLSDLSEPDIHRSQDEVDNLTRSQRVLRPRTHSTRSSSSGRNVDMHFSEVDVIESRHSRVAKDDYSCIRSSEDISSGYSSAEPLPGGLSRTASMTNASKIRLRSKKSEDLDSLEFESLISDPLSVHSKILLNRYPMKKVCPLVTPHYLVVRRPNELLSQNQK